MNGRLRLSAQMLVATTAADASQSGLDKLHEIALPDPVKWIPQTSGWYVLLGLLILAGAWWGYSRWRRYRENRYRRLALEELTVIESELRRQEQRARALAEIPGLLKRTALSAFPRSEVARLSGEQWLDFLDRTMGGDEFKAGGGRVLPELAYAPAPVIEGLSDQSTGKLLQLVRRWIRVHVSV